MCANTESAASCAHACSWPDGSTHADAVQCCGGGSTCVEKRTDRRSVMVAARARILDQTKKAQ